MTKNWEDESMHIKQLFKRQDAGDSGVAFSSVPFLCSLLPLFAGLFLLLFAGSVMAAEPAYLTLGFSNGGESEIQIMITDTDTQATETLTIPANQTVEKTWKFTEPGVRKLLVENTDPNANDSAYYVYLYSELDEQSGKLIVNAVAQIDGTDDKAGELVFGVTNESEEPEDPEEPQESETKPSKKSKTKTPTADKPVNDSENTNYKTGDSANPALWIGVGAGFFVLVILLFVLLIRRRRNEDGARK